MFEKLAKQRNKDLENLSKARDERCIPIAKELIKLIGNEESSVGSNVSGEQTKVYSDIATKVLATLLAKDVMFEDISFIFRLVLEHLLQSFLEILQFPASFSNCDCHHLL